MKKVFTHTYDTIITIENLLCAWEHFKYDKKHKTDVQVFERDLMHNIISLYTDLKNRTYIHGVYYHFTIIDPKKRDIHKASVRDRIVHHLLYDHLYLFFHTTFISDSYSCRIGKGTHRANQRFKKFLLKESKNMTKQCYILKCDIRKFFASIDHRILKNILEQYIADREVLGLLYGIIDSFPTGLPLGNLTSQLLVNIYMNVFDQYVKHKLKVQYYIRYADDFVMISQDKNYLKDILRNINIFLNNDLKLTLHPDKVSLHTLYTGIDFLGWIEYGTHRIIRTNTKHRMFKKLSSNEYQTESVQSYLGLLKHGNTYKLQNQVLEENK